MIAEIVRCKYGVPYFLDDIREYGTLTIRPQWATTLCTARQHFLTPFVLDTTGALPEKFPSTYNLRGHKTVFFSFLYHALPIKYYIQLESTKFNEHENNGITLTERFILFQYHFFLRSLVS